MIIILDLILELIFPNKCIVCGKIIEFGRKNFLCAECKDLFKFIDDKRCEKCSRPIENGELCSMCMQKNYCFDKNYSLLVYDELMHDLIVQFKFKNHPAIGRGLGKIMAQKFDMNADFIIPVPIHKMRRRNRGFNQAEILAKEISKRTGIPLRLDILKRIKNTRAQWRLNPHERANNLKGAFASKNVDGKKIILIDDIFTTGSTINECAQVLKTAGADKVFSYTLSITVKKDSADATQKLS